MSVFTIGQTVTAAIAATALDPDTTLALLKTTQAAMKGDTSYAEYVTKHGIASKEHVADHVAALKEIAYPGIKGSSSAPKGSDEYDARNFAAKVRNGLTRALTKAATDDDDAQVTNLLSAAGFKALTEMINTGTPAEQIMITVLAEIERRSASTQAVTPVNTAALAA